MRKYITKKGQEKLLKELRRLKEELVPKLSKEIEEARAQGDLSENAEYHAAKEQLTNVQKRIAKLQNTLASSLVIDEERMSSDKVYLGAKVVLEDKNGTKLEYTIVSPEEADPIEGLISSESPLGKAIIGRKVSDVVEFEAPQGLMELKIISITR
ncbi:MAG: transcription elongation factor GreA, partial [Elusimicrobia bacterium]|nr:transcription elongation factor GreA [Elusimicrobiota bacterium]